MAVALLAKPAEKKGEFLILDRSWYRDTVNAFMYGEIDKETRDTRLKDICTFERQLTDDGYVIVKNFSCTLPKTSRKKAYRKAGELLCYKLACGKPRYKEHGKIR